MNGKLRIKLDGKEVKLWFNRFAQLKAKDVFKIESVDEGEATQELTQAIQKRLEKSELLLVCDLIWLGVFGQAMAYDEDFQLERSEIRLAVADIELDEIAKVSKAFFKAMGSDIKKQTAKAKKGKKPTKKK